MDRKFLVVASALLAATPAAAQDLMWMDDRPDAQAPLGVPSARVVDVGTFLVTYRYSDFDSEGLYSGTQLVPFLTAFDFYDVAPFALSDVGHSLEVAWGASEDLTIQGRIAYRQFERQQLTFDSIFFVTESDGLSDLEVSALYEFYDEGPYRAHVEGGLVIPTGDDDVVIDGQAAPYDLRTGGGVFGIVPGATVQTQNESGSVGAQVRGQIYFGENGLGYRPGNRIDLTGWAAYRANEYFSVSGRIAYQDVGRIQQADIRLDPALDPGNDAFFVGRSRVDLPVGVNLYMPPGQRFAGSRIAIEYYFPVHQDFDGIQLGLDNGLVVGAQIVF